VTSPPAVANSGVHAGSDDGHTRISPDWRVVCAGSTTIRATPSTTPAETPVPTSVCVVVRAFHSRNFALAGDERRDIDPAVPLVLPFSYGDVGDLAVRVLDEREEFSSPEKPHVVRVVEGVLENEMLARPLDRLVPRCEQVCDGVLRFVSEVNVASIRPEQMTHERPADGPEQPSLGTRL